MSDTTIHLEPRLILCCAPGCTNEGKYEAIATLDEHHTYVFNSPVCSDECAQAYVDNLNSISVENGGHGPYRLGERR